MSKRGYKIVDSKPESTRIAVTFEAYEMVEGKPETVETFHHAFPLESTVEQIEEAVAKHVTVFFEDLDRSAANAEREAQEAAATATSEQLKDKEGTV